MELTPQFGAFVVSAAALFISLLSGIFAYMARRRAATEDQVREIKERVALAEVRIESLPSAESWSHMCSNIAGIRGDVKTASAEVHGLGEGLSRVERQMSLLMEHALKGNKE